MPLEVGLIQVYYGNGKGKTTASLGLALRAAGQGLKVYIAQFLKPSSAFSGEVESLAKLEDNIVLERINEESFLGPISDELRERAIALFEKELAQIKIILKEAEYDLVILDEILNALSLELIDEKNLRELLQVKHTQVELVLSGRKAPEWLIAEADLVSEISMVKHPYEQGVKARRGIEF